MDIRKDAGLDANLERLFTSEVLFMVFVKVRETYDLHTVQNKMTLISIHTPKPDIIKANFPGLLMQCKAYRPVSCDVRVACASTLPLDPLGVGTGEGDVAPEDLFNPILYKACTNFGMSQIEARIFANGTRPVAGIDVNGNSATVDVDTLTSFADEFPLYYGFLSNAHGWRHANPQAGLEMTGLKPLVYEVLANSGDFRPNASDGTVGNIGNVGDVPYPTAGGLVQNISSSFMKGNAKPLPFMNCTSYTSDQVNPGFQVPPGVGVTRINNSEIDVPWINCVVGAIIVPPSRLHELFYRMVCEWTIEFSSIRPIGEITNWAGLGALADITHYQNYDYSTAKKILTGTDETVLDSDSCMVSANVDVKKVM